MLWVEVLENKPAADSFDPAGETVRKIAIT